jgi:hypothetical protein
MDQKTRFFEIQPFTRKAEEVWSDRIMLFFSVLLAAVLFLFFAVGAASAVWTDLLGGASVWSALEIKKWLPLFAGLSCAVALASVWAYSRSRTPEGMLSACIPAPHLVAHSAGLLSWACAFEHVQELTREPTIWFVEWRTNPFGMHAERLLAHNVSGRPAFSVAFDALPQENRFVPWPSDALPYWSNHTASATCKALVPVLSAHVRMGLARAAIV